MLFREINYTLCFNSHFRHIYCQDAIRWLASTDFNELINLCITKDISHKCLDVSKLSILYLSKLYQYLKSHLTFNFGY